MRSKHCLTASDAQKIIVACNDAAQKNSWKVSVAIVDEGGYLIRLERLGRRVSAQPGISFFLRRYCGLIPRSDKISRRARQGTAGYHRFSRKIACPRRCPGNLQR